jgi:hypothetical protein
LFIACNGASAPNEALGNWRLPSDYTMMKSSPSGFDG